MESDVYRAMYELEDRHWWFRGRRAVIWSLLLRAGATGQQRLLDAGCGTGRHLVEFGSHGEAYGVDPSPEAVAACHERGLTNVAQAPIEALPYPDGHFDLVLAADVLEHVDDDAEALRELRRVSKPGAALLCTVPALMWLWSDEDVRLHHRRRYRRSELVDVARRAGWEPAIATYFNTLLLPPIAAARRLRRLREAPPGSSEMERSSGPLSGLLAVPMRLEAAALRRGIRFPVGVSVGMVARAKPQHDHDA